MTFDPPSDPEATSDIDPDPDFLIRYTKGRGVDTQGIDPSWFQDYWDDGGPPCITLGADDFSDPGAWQALEALWGFLESLRSELHLSDAVVNGALSHMDQLAYYASDLAIPLTAEQASRWGFTDDNHPTAPVADPAGPAHPGSPS